MNIKHLYYFLVIAETHSINKAAHKLFISQQHLSRIVTALENDLHTKLFERTSKGIQLTEKGEVFRHFADKIVTDYRELQSYFYLDSLPSVDQDQPIQGYCKIAFPFFFSLFLNDYIQKLNARYPAVSINCFESAHSYSIDELYHSDMLHLLLDTPNDDLSDTEQKLTFYHIGNTTAIFCVNAASPLARKHQLTPQDIASQRLTSYMLSNHFFPGANVLFTSSNIYQHLDSVIHNNSICVVPAYICSGICANYPDIALIPYEKHAAYPIHLVHSNQQPLSIADKAVLRFTAEYIQQLSQFHEKNV